MKHETQPDQLGYLLVQICKAHRNRAQAALSEIGLHAGQEMILMHLYTAEGLTQSQLVESLCVEPPTVTKMLQRMEAAGMVERRQDGEDARISRVYLTPNGRAIEEQVCGIWQQLDDETVAGLSDVEQALLRRLLQQVYANLAT
jgi:DNA-binding MarR family transcriptional regulator